VKKFLLIIICVSCVLYIYFELGNKKIQSKANQTIEVRITNSKSEKLVNTTLPGTKLVNSNKQVLTPDITQNEMLDLIEWNQSRGYFAKNNPYNDYELETLGELSNQGDALAELTLGKRLVSMGNIKDGGILLLNASIAGYTSSLSDLSSIELSKYLKGKDKSDSEMSLIMAYAYVKVAEIRGDVNSKTLLESLNSNSIYKLTDKQLISVEEHTEETYQYLQNARQQKGLSKFDNSRPKALAKLQEIILKNQKKLQSYIRK
jgi:hypothetical protein